MWATYCSIAGHVLQYCGLRIAVLRATHCSIAGHVLQYCGPRIKQVNITSKYSSRSFFPEDGITDSERLCEEAEREMEIGKQVFCSATLRKRNCFTEWKRSDLIYGSRFKNSSVSSRYSNFVKKSSKVGRNFFFFSFWYQTQLKDWKFSERSGEKNDVLLFEINIKFLFPSVPLINIIFGHFLRNKISHVFLVCHKIGQKVVTNEECKQGPVKKRTKQTLAKYSILKKTKKTENSKRQAAGKMAKCMLQHHKGRMSSSTC